MAPTSLLCTLWINSSKIIVIITTQKIPNIKIKKLILNTLHYVNNNHVIICILLFLFKPRIIILLIIFEDWRNLHLGKCKKIRTMWVSGRPLRPSEPGVVLLHFWSSFYYQEKIMGSDIFTKITWEFVGPSLL